MAEQDILVLGGGSLARAICYALAAIDAPGRTVTVVSRAAQSAEEICYIADVRADLSGVCTSFRSLTLPRYTVGRLRSLFERFRPAIVLNCASLQSPWERLVKPSAWTDLIATVGYGITLPLQAVLAIEVGTALSDAGSDALFFNACLPDAVNPLLRHLGLPVFSGIGNVAILTASIRQALGLDASEHLQVLGHHWHLHRPPSDEQDALVWHAGEPVADVGSLLTRQRGATRQELNIVNGQVTALLLDAVLTGREVRVSLPGPGGLPGGYPVCVRGRDIRLDLPPGLTLDQAMQKNQVWARQDGVSVDGEGQVHFSHQRGQDIVSVVPELTEVLPGDDVPKLLPRLLELRAQLREQPSADGDRRRVTPTLD